MYWMATVVMKVKYILCRSVTLPKQFTHHLLLLTIVWQGVFGIHSRDRYNPNVLVKTKTDFFLLL